MREARRGAAFALALGACFALPARAQTAEQPNLIFTISGGILTGGNLWSIARQLALADSGGPGHTWDTVSLGRKLRSGFSATLAATYFGMPHFGLSLEAGFFGLESVASCRPVGPLIVTPDNRNAQACSYLAGQNLRGDAVGLLAGLVYRVTTRGIQPYIRAAGGGAILGSSYVEAVAPVLLSGGAGTTTVYFLADQNHKELTWMVSLSAGLMLPLTPGYQLRLEARDLIVALPYPKGPATDTGSVANSAALPQPPIGMKVAHVPTISIGLDVVLERRRGRRY